MTRTAQHRSFSLRSILMLTIGILTLLIAVLSIGEFYGEWRKWNKIQNLKHAVLISQQFFNSIEQLSREREITAALLYSPNEAVDKNLVRQLQNSRQEAEAGLNSILADLKHLRPTADAKIVRNFEHERAQLVAIRQQADQVLTLPLDARDAAIHQQWFNTSTQSIGATYNLWVGFTRNFTKIDPIITQRLMFQHFLGLIIRYAGREHALISGLIVADRPITPDDQAQLLRWRGVIEQGWEMCARLSERSGLAPEITPYLKDAESHYLSVYEMVENLFYVPGTSVHDYPITVDQWLDVAGGSNDSLNALKNAALLQTEHYAQRLEHRAEQSMLLHALVLLAALGLCLYSFRVVNRRVIGPIRQMVDALLATAETTPLSEPIAHEGDEISNLAHVLQRFQQNSQLVRESQERYKALVESSSQIVWRWSDGMIDELSPLGQWWEETTGQAAKNIATLGWLDVVHPDDCAPMQKIWQTALETGQNYEMEYRIRARNGTYRHVAVRGVVLHAPDGSIRELIGSLNDVTERKEVEENIRRYMRDLERSNKELDDFAYIASHDLKEPLRGIHNHSRFLLEDNADKLDTPSVDRLNRLLYLTQRMEKLVNDLLYFSRLGRQELAIQSTNLNQVVQDIESFIDVFLTERHARIIVPKPLPTITCDQTRVTEALRNLITNAVKYNDSPEKIVEIGMLSNYTLPDATTARQVFYVKDNGVGIPLEFHAEVFRIFKRLQASNQQEDGTGVGLTFVKKIIERHGGKIWLESQPGQGTIFYFTLGRTSHETSE